MVSADKSGKGKGYKRVRQIERTPAEVEAQELAALACVRPEPGCCPQHTEAISIGHVQSELFDAAFAQWKSNEDAEANAVLHAVCGRWFRIGDAHGHPCYARQKQDYWFHSATGPTPL